jgi:cytochrome c peroxidase
LRILRHGTGFALALFVFAAAHIAPSAADQPALAQASPWSDAELKIIRSLSIGSLPPLAPDPSNKVGDDPRAASLGHRLFFDTRFSADDQVSCATCHLPAAAFTDGRKLGRGVGTAGRNTMTLLGAAYSPWFFWDGRKDSQWSQALGPLESDVEHGGTRTGFAQIIALEGAYKTAYEELFGDLPDLSDPSRFPPSAGPVADENLHAAWRRMAAEDRDAVNRVFANIGKAVAAYQRLLLPGPSRFDRYADAVVAGNSAEVEEIFTANEANGLRLFIGSGQCTRCHNGPLLTNNDFHNTGVPRWPSMPHDQGRIDGIAAARADIFNCRGAYSDASAGDCRELRFAKTGGPELVGAMKTPTLRSVSKTGPYMHAGQYATLAPVLDHYNRAPTAQIGTSELEPLGLTRDDLNDLRDFLLTLDSPPAVEPKYLSPPD